MKKQILFLLIPVSVFFSCENDMKKVREVTLNESPSDKSFKEVNLIYTDSGNAKAVMIAPLLEVFTKNDKEKWVFPNGLRVEFYDEKESKESEMTANYGVFDQQLRKLTVQNNVILINFKKQDTLNTELLNWSQDSAKLYTDKMVLVKGKDGIYQAQGITANETFSRYDLWKFKAHYIYTENEIKNQ